MWILLSLLGFLFLILIHESGHFVAARFFKVIVEEFGFGIPPRIKTMFVQGGTKFSLNWIPFGGFVRLRGENAESAAERLAPGSFARASIVARCVILVAGVAMNFLFALLIFVIGFSVGHLVPSYLSLPEMMAASARGEIHFVPGVMIDEVLPNGTAAQVKVPAGSVVLKVDNTDVVAPEDVSRLQQGKALVTYTLLRTPDAKTPEVINVPLQAGKSGVALRPYARELTVPRHGLGTALYLATRETKVVTEQTVMGIGKLVSSLVKERKVPSDVKGIVGIARIGKESVHEGWMTYLRLLAQLSLSLAIFNVLPFPALDGGRLIFVIAEAILRHPVNRRFELTTHALGFLILIALIMAVTYNDIVDLIWN